MPRNSFLKKIPRKYYFLTIPVFLSLILTAIAGSYYFHSINDIKPETKTKIEVQRPPVAQSDMNFNFCLSESVITNSSVISDYIDQLDDKWGKFSLNTAKECDLTLTNKKIDATYTQRINSTLYIPVARFDSSFRELNTDQLKTLLSAESLNGAQLMVAETVPTSLNTSIEFSPSLQKLPIDTIKNSLESDKNIIGLIPFEEFDPIMRIIKVEGQTPFNKTFNKETYPLLSQVWLNGNDKTKDIFIDLADNLNTQLGEENYQPEQLKDLILSGTSILGGRTHWFAEKESGDPLFPIRGLADTFRNADLAHLSNEASFIEDCIQEEQTLAFCGTLESFQMMKFAGIDLVGVTANHELDQGRPAFESTLDLYTQHEIIYFGGGKDFDDAHTPKVVEFNGIKVAFLGYNFIPPYTYYSGRGFSGTAQPDQYVNGDKIFMIEDIAKAKELADFIIIDMQWGDEYTHEPNIVQQEYGRAAIDAGANIINGVHPHYVQGLEYYKNGVIFYGLGNTLFDQLREDALRESVLAKHIFYKGKYMGYDLIPVVTEYNLQTVLAGDDRKDKILNTIYQYSLINR